MIRAARSSRCRPRRTSRSRPASRRQRADLQLGKNVQAAYDEAQKLIEDGKAQVAEMIKEAEAKAEGMVAEAEKKVAAKQAQRHAIMAELRELAAEMEKIRDGWP